MASIETNNLVGTLNAIAGCYIGEDANPTRYAACCAFLRRCLEDEQGLTGPDAAIHAYWAAWVGEVGEVLNSLVGGA